jgi:hypothetical protein
MDRRNFVMAAAGFASLVGFTPLAVAQEASPAHDHGAGALTGLGLPEINITVTATSYEGIPASIEAGRYLVTATVAEGVEYEGGGIGFVQPSGMSAEEFLETAFGDPDSEEAAGEFSDALFEATFAGGTYVMSGATTQIVLDLGPGQWFVWGDGLEAAQEPFAFEVTGEMPADLFEPESGATITMGEYIIEVTAGELVAGSQVVKVENIGAQPHFVTGGKVSDGTTVDQVATALHEEMEAEMTGTPVVYSGWNPEQDFEFLFSTATQSIGTEVWVVLDLEPATYGLVCFFPDLADGAPHAYHGMYNVIEVGG